MGKKRGGVRFTVIAAAVVLSFAGSANALSPDLDFFNGKVINYVVSTKPGGGYDAYARIIGKYMQKYLPGSTVIVKNVPGAGNIIGANEIYLAKPNGLTIGTFNTGLIYSQIVGSQGVKFDLAKYSWIGKASSQTRVFVVSVNTPYKTFKDILESKDVIKMSASGVGTADYNDVLLVAAATGANLKVIPGYMGQENEMAMLRGEVAGQLGSYTGLNAFIKAKECRVLLQLGTKRHKDLKDVPLAAELNLPAKSKKIIAVINSMAELGRLTAAPPNMPAGRLQVLRDAYKKAVTDPNLISDIEKMGMDMDPSIGEEVARMVRSAVNQPAENIALLKQIIKIEGN